MDFIIFIGKNIDKNYFVSYLQQKFDFGEIKRNEPKIGHSAERFGYQLIWHLHRLVSKHLST